MLLHFVIYGIWQSSLKTSTSAQPAILHALSPATGPSDAAPKSNAPTANLHVRVLDRSGLAVPLAFGGTGNVLLYLKHSDSVILPHIPQSSIVCVARCLRM